MDRDPVYEPISHAWDVYTDIDQELCNLDCKILNNCHLGIIPKTISIEDIECIG
jgi:hypothetical protein